MAELAENEKRGLIIIRANMIRPNCVIIIGHSSVLVQALV